MPEGFHEGVVGQFARPVHALDEPERREARAVGIGRILDAAIRMEDESRRRFAPPQRLVESRQRQAQIALQGQCRAQDAARVAVHDHGQIAPLATDFQVCHVPDPDLIGCRGLAFQYPVGDRREEYARTRHVSVDARRTRLQVGCPHQAGHTLACHVDAGLRQRRMNARRTVGACAGLEDRADAHGQACIAQVVRTGASAAPSVVARARDAVTRAQRLYAKPVLLRFDEREDGAL